MKVMQTSDFKKNPFAEYVKATFPGVRDFKVDHMVENVQPVEYSRGSSWNLFGRKSYGVVNEYPPVASWKVGNQIVRYVLSPRFKEEQWSAILVGGTQIKADYSHEDEVLFKLLKWSSEGYTADEINKMLEPHRRDNQSHGETTK